MNGREEIKKGGETQENTLSQFSLIKPKTDPKTEWSTKKKKKTKQDKTRILLHDVHVLSSATISVRYQFSTFTFKFNTVTEKLM